MKWGDRYAIGQRKGVEAYQRGEPCPPIPGPQDRVDALYAGFLSGWEEAQMLELEGVAIDQGAAAALATELAPCPYVGDEQERLREGWIYGWTSVATSQAHGFPEEH